MVGWPAFIDVQVAYRLRDQGAPDEIHTDVTLGVRPMSRPAAAAARPSTRPTSARERVWFPHERFTHIQAGVVYDFAEAWSAELAGYTTVFGRHSLRENGLTTAVWYRF